MNFLIKYLGGIPAISNRLSAPKYGVRLYKHRAVENCPLPYAVVTELGGVPDYELAGELPDVVKTYQVDVYAASDDEANEIAELIRLAPLSGYRGTMDTTYVHSVTIASERGPDDFRSDGSDTPYSRNQRDYRIRHDRAVVHSS